MKTKSSNGVTVMIQAELEIMGDWDRDVEVVITTDEIPTTNQATKIVQILFPNRVVTRVQVKEI